MVPMVPSTWYFWYLVKSSSTLKSKLLGIVLNGSKMVLVLVFILHSIHNACNDFIPKFLKGSYGSDAISQIDDAWLAFGSGDNLQQNEIENPCVKLTKVNGVFEFPSGTEEMLWKILGPREEDAQSPKTYLSNDDAFAKMYPVVVKVNGKDKVKYKTNELDFLRH